MRVVEVSAYGEPEVLHVADRPEPLAGPGEVVIRVAAAGVTRADALQRAGRYPPPAGASDLPGLEVAGTIVALGAGVTDWAVGTAVCALCNGGGYAEWVAVPHGQVLPMPARWTPVEAATLPENAFTVWDNLFTRARLAAGETVLVHGGTSGIGTTAIMFARAFGAHPIATAGSPAKCRAACELGAEHAIDYRSEDFVAAVAALTGGRGVDVVLDIVGGDYIARDLEALALDGRIACIASQGDPHVTLDVRAMLARRAALLASSLRARTAEQKAAIASELRARVWPLLPRRDPIRPVVDSVFTFAQAPQAHRRLETSRHIGKIVLVPDASSQPVYTEA